MKTRWDIWGIGGKLKVRIILGNWEWVLENFQGASLISNTFSQVSQTRDKVNRGKIYHPWNGVKGAGTIEWMKEERCAEKRGAIAGAFSMASRAHWQGWIGEWIGLIASEGSGQRRQEIMGIWESQTVREAKPDRKEEDWERRAWIVQGEMNEHDEWHPKSRQKMLSSFRISRLSGLRDSVRKEETVSCKAIAIAKIRLKSRSGEIHKRFLSKYNHLFILPTLWNHWCTHEMKGRNVGKKHARNREMKRRAFMIQRY